MEGVIAQLVEQRTENPCVPGSIPGDTTNRKTLIIEFQFVRVLLFYKTNILGTQRDHGRLKLMENKEVLEFVTYCISKLGQFLNMSQRDVYTRLKKSGILDGYIIPCYDVLHSFGSRYLMEDITEYMREKGVL